MFGLFENPKCPNCGRELEPTYHAFPYPQWRCPYCIKENERINKDKQKIKELEERLKKLEDKNYGQN